MLAHFDKYALITKKKIDYEFFKQGLILLKNKEHLTNEGFANILNLKAAMNFGLSKELQEKFPYVIPISRSLHVDYSVKNPN